MIIDKDRLLEEGKAIKPKPMSDEQINTFIRLNKYKTQESFDRAWEKKKLAHKTHWEKLYENKKLVIYPKLKLAWRRYENGKFKIVYKQLTWWTHCKVTLPPGTDLIERIESICYANYCQFEPDVDYEQETGFVVFMSLPELCSEDFKIA